tara:strand:+ start:280 stop:525 length:246 start_codon:yes stop_codon:yes gene_type:complete
MSEAKEQKDESDLSALLCAKSGLISIAARLAICKVLMELEEVCENQKTISTDKLQSMLDKVSSKLKDEAVHVRNMAMKIST